MERAERVAEIVEAALDRDQSSWAQLLEETCGDDKELRQEVESLLGYQKEATDFIETPAYAGLATLLVAESGELKPEERLGDYKIVSLLGEGGMGEVYLAEDTKLGRQVAIKLVKAGVGRSSLLRHFQREEKILAGLTHPNIARLYGAASAPNGTPYFVMEYVDGERLDAYCDRQRLTIRDRLQLFRKICGAVAYAHQRLVIHRDLKPSNIRVTSEGEPKLLDFGIARLTEEKTAIPEQTMTFSSAMTPEYASPEQIRGESMTTASDVYSLGVVLYELLTGTKPYRTTSRRLDEIARAITEQEATKPSNALSREKSKFEIRNSKILRGDLDNIVLTAIRKEPSRRYTSVDQFSEDIRRHLAGLPVRARRDTIGYRTSKFVARHRVSVAAAAMVAVAIIASLLVAVWQARIASRQRDVAQTERLKTQRINTFLQDMLGSAAPEAKGVDVKVADVLEEASKKAKADLATDPEVMTDVLLTLGRTYISLAQYEQGEKNLRAALEASLKINGELHPTTASAMGWLAIALAFQNKFIEGESTGRRAVQLQRQLHPGGHEDLGIALYGLGVSLLTKGDLKGAVPALEQASETIKTHFGETHGYYMTSLVMLARSHELMGNVDVAEALYRKAVAVGRHVERRYRIFIAQAQAFVGLLLINKSEFAEAETALREAENIYREVLGGENNGSVATVKANLALLYHRQQQYAKAEAEGRIALDLLRKFSGPEHPITAATGSTLGVTLSQQAKAEEGETLLREALRIRRKVLPPDNYQIPLSESLLGECLAIQKRFAEAEPLLTSGYNALKATMGAADQRVIEARQRLAKLYDDWGKPEQAAQFR
jgi:eukaryotic-like serine/threonine-protein kinase